MSGSWEGGGNDRKGDSSVRAWWFLVVPPLLGGHIGDTPVKGDQLIIYASPFPWWRKLEKSRGEVKSIPALWGDSRSLRELGKSVGETGRQRMLPGVQRALELLFPRIS